MKPNIVNFLRVFCTLQICLPQTSTYGLCSRANAICLARGFDKTARERRQ